MTRRRDPAITTLASLRAHLQVAMQVEHATIPPYFTAWVSIPAGTNLEAAAIIRSVMLEEMLHLTQAANLLNAVGGRPRLTGRTFVPRYPHRLPHSGNTFEVSVERLSPAALRTFLKIEKPERKGARPEPGHFHTLGQFYEAIAQAIDTLCERLGEARVFSGDVTRQVQPAQYYGSGSLYVVTDRTSAHQAIAEIVEQGEGTPGHIFDGDRKILGDGEGEEVAHYYRFLELLEGRSFTRRDTAKSGPTGARIPLDFTAMYPLRPNSRAQHYPKGSAHRAALQQFASSYRALLVALERSFNGEPQHFTEGIARMFTLHQQAVALAQTPSGDGRTTLGLDFGGR
jgi:hypothetical protein